MLFIAVLALVAAPVLAGCATNNNTTSTSSTPASSTVSSTTPSTPSGGNQCVAPAAGAAVPGAVELHLGIMMPLTGGLSSLGPDMCGGALLAVKEINAANLGVHITADVADDKTSNSADAPNTFQRLVGGGATAIVGPCCSGVTSSILSAAGDGQVVVASPSATAVSLVDSGNGFFWRISPSDAIQGPVLANVVKNDSVTSVSIIAVNNAYGQGLVASFTPAFTAKGGSVVTTQKYAETGASDFSSQVTAACNGNPQAVVIFGYIAEGALILKEMQKEGCLSKVKLYGSEGLYDSDSKKGLPTQAGQDSAGHWLAAGAKGTNPQSGNSSVFNTKFNAAYGHDPSQYSAESYDAVMYIALAALKANSAKGADIKANLLAVANPPGQKCTEWAACAALAKAGQDLDYQGYAHDFQFSDKHEPQSGFYSVWKVGDDGKVATVATDQTA
jgi:ABC-type branched-subunit amino acid transport system substrate-binding protein